MRLSHVLLLTTLTTLPLVSADYNPVATNGLVCFTPREASLIAARLADWRILTNQVEVYQVRVADLEAGLTWYRDAYTSATNRAPGSWRDSVGKYVRGGLVGMLIGFVGGLVLVIAVR